jgi:hypothetical protein
VSAQHDCEYTRKRSALVPIGAERATESVPFVPFEHGEEMDEVFRSGNGKALSALAPSTLSLLI